MANTLVEVRNKLKAKKPTFRRQQINQYAKFKNFDGWRRPKGLQSKMRLKEAGHRRMPAIGYKSPKAVKGLNRAGKREVLVYNVADLAKVQAGTDVAIIGRTVGGRKTIDILNKAKEMKVELGNVFDVDKRISELTKTPKKKVEKKVEVKVEKETVAKTEKTTKKEEAEKWI